MLCQITRIVNTEKPDVFLLCGDVFDTTQTSAATQKMYVNAIINIKMANPDMTIIVTAGNHDSGSKLEIHKSLWDNFGCITIGYLHKDTPESHIIKIDGKGFVIALPYTHRRNIPEGFIQNLLDTVSEQNIQNLPIIMTAHTTICGCDFSGHNRSNAMTVGNIDAINIEDMGSGYDYLALGHIHHKQFIHTGKHNVRYSGSPIAISFDEQYTHSISVIDIDKHNDTPQVKEIEIDNIRPLVTLPASDFTTLDSVLESLKNYPDDIPAYIRLNVKVDDFLPATANIEAENICKDKACRFCLFNTTRTEKTLNKLENLSIQEFQAKRPLDIVKLYADTKGIVFDEELEMLFNETLSRVLESNCE